MFAAVCSSSVTSSMVAARRGGAVKSANINKKSGGSSCSAFVGNTSKLQAARPTLARRAPVAAMASVWSEMSGA